MVRLCGIGRVPGAVREHESPVWSVQYLQRWDSRPNSLVPPGATSLRYSLLSSLSAWLIGTDHQLDHRRLVLDPLFPTVSGDASLYPSFI